MKPDWPFRPPSPAGYSLIEVMIVVFLISGVTVIAMTLYIAGIGQAQDGSAHLSAVASARRAERTMVSFIQNARAVGAITDGLEIVQSDLTVSRISYVDGDGDPATRGDNCLLLDPDIAVASNETELCSSVSPIPGEAMFSVLTASPRTAIVTFHVGDRPPISGPSVYGRPGHPGLEIRCAATPRGAKGTGR
jgi:prepilin-type N-terminal cleavage/methylation domain-containing protein